MLMEAAKAWVGQYMWVITASVLLLTLLAIQAEGSIAVALDLLLPMSMAHQIDSDGHGPPAPISAAILTLTGGCHSTEVEHMCACLVPIQTSPCCLCPLDVIVPALFSPSSVFCSV